MKRIPFGGLKRVVRDTQMATFWRDNEDNPLRGIETFTSSNSAAWARLESDTGYSTPDGSGGTRSTTPWPSRKEHTWPCSRGRNFPGLLRHPTHHRHYLGTSTQYGAITLAGGTNGERLYNQGGGHLDTFSRLDESPTPLLLNSPPGAVLRRPAGKF